MTLYFTVLGGKYPECFTVLNVAQNKRGTVKTKVKVPAMRTRKVKKKKVTPLFRPVHDFATVYGFARSSFGSFSASYNHTVAGVGPLCSALKAHRPIEISALGFSAILKGTNQVDCSVCR